MTKLTTAPRDPREVAPERRIPEPLVRVCLQALSKDQNDRYLDADAMSEALATAMAEVEGTRAQPQRARTPEAPCPSCGAMNAATQKFCGECGTPLIAMDSLRAGRASLFPSAMGEEERTLPGLAGRRTLSGERALPLPLPPSKPRFPAP